MADLFDPILQINVLLDSSSTETVGTSMRIPVALRQAAALAVTHLGAADSATALATDALRERLEAVVIQAALDRHYAEHPEARPSLVELATMAAEIDGNPLAHRPDLLATAAEEIVRTHPGADADDVLLWAEALSTCEAAR